MDKTVGDFVTVAKAAYQNDSERGKNRYGETECWLRPVSWRGNKTAYTFYAYDKYSKLIRVESELFYICGPVILYKRYPYRIARKYNFMAKII